MLYKIIKIIVRIAIRVFFKSFKVSGKDLIPHKGPLIVVSNHPNTFMDPLIIASILKPQVYFLANSSIFNTGFTRWLFDKLHMIPIQRKEDTNKNKYDNTQIFQKCFDFLAKKGTLLIFPEGTSIRARRLQKIKSGTARIALGAESQHNFNLNLQILSIGLNYSKPDSFRSEVFVQIDEVILVKDYQKKFESDAEDAIKILSEELRKKIEEHVIVTANDEQDRFVKQIETVYKSKLSEDITLSTDEEEQDFLITQGIADAVNHFEEKEPQRYKEVRTKVQIYLNNLNRLKLSDELFDKKTKSSNLILLSLWTLLSVIAGFPIYLYGLINNYLPYIIPSKVAAWIVKKSKADEYTAPVMMVTGVFSFFFFYILQILGVEWFLDNVWFSLLYALSLPLSGFFTLFYADYLADTNDKWRLFTLFYKRANLVSSLIQQRAVIIRLFEEAKKDYLEFYEKK